MSSLTYIRKLRAALALSVAFSVIVGPVVGSDALAAASSRPMDQVGDQLRDQLNDVMNTPFDFCDPATEHAYFMAITRASGNLFRHQLANHNPGPDDVKLAEDKVIQTAKADGDLTEDCKIACNNGSDAILVQRGSRCADRRGLKQVELDASVHLALHELELCDLTFSLAVGP